MRAATVDRPYGNTCYTLRDEGGDKPRPYGDTGKTGDTDDTGNTVDTDDTGKPDDTGNTVIPTTPAVLFSNQ